MASMNDALDIMGFASADGAQGKQPPLKKQKSTLHKRATGINREVQALYGERAPPVAVVDAGKTYQPKRRWAANKGPAVKWGMRPFINEARTDGLVLRHWRKLQGAQEQAENDTTAANEEGQDPLLESTQYEFAKFNIKPEVPEYDDETYDAYLRSDDWSKEETDYLIETVKEYYHRWAVIVDRYDFQPSSPTADGTGADGAALTIVAKPRTMEDMKARYYQITAKLMETRTPIAHMTNQEFGLHEILTKFDPERETQRKKVAASLLERSQADIEEERFLLGELQRINANYDKLRTEREEVRARLGAPQSVANTSAAQFQSSAALSQLFNQLLQQDRSKKRNGRLSLNTQDVQGPSSGINTPAGHGHRDSISSAQPNKRASLTGNPAQPQSALPRTLSPKAMVRLGVSHHERLTSGVTFRSDRLNKLRLAKSTIQTQKIQQALIELKIPEIINLPTNDVCDAFEQLINKIHKILDLRKLLEKEEGEVMVAENIRAERLRRERIEAGEEIEGDRGGEGEGEVKKDENAAAPAPNGVDAEMADAPNGADNEVSGGEGGEEAEDFDDNGVKQEKMDEDGRPRSSSGPHHSKRSASVLSAASHMSNRSKRSRK
ncbi:hypothetical protein K490DRAFT_74682 [Saccharata proteae CBS 121410]|uniref:SWR1-complex protein 4 n=1 Tax=Saccharata proteae CBS 121410 TaxID=1314787 RepID=A0A9P4HSN1_9PEZI|nr:hypothetical protein K490DRAFT_74682 [Saccharata proteae CBS 121410]